jgi:hypothetical protein
VAVGGGDFDAEFLGQGRRHGSTSEAPIPKPGLGGFPGPIEALEVVIEDRVGLAAAVHKPVSPPDLRG